jgi:hypothetical protein
MKDLRGARWFRLATKPDGARMRCDENGAFWGPVSLITKTANTTGRQSWVPRAVNQLERELTALSELPIDLASKENGLNAVARALNDGNIALAQIAMLNLQLPDLPDQQRPLHQSICSKSRAASGKAAFSRTPNLILLNIHDGQRGASASRGGRFRAANDNDQVSAEASGPGDKPIVVAGLTREQRCRNKCLHLLHSPSGDLQSSEYRKCHRECIGSL